MTFLYFAYGSNMLSLRLKDRCHSAKKLRIATAIDFELNFSKSSKDGSGKAGIVSAAGTSVLGVVYQVDKGDLPALDKHEGAGFGYERIDNFSVLNPEDESVITTTYLPTMIDLKLKPYDWYLALVLAGAIENQFPKEYILRLRDVNFEPDCRANQEKKLEAMDLLKRSGFNKLQRKLEFGNFDKF